MDSGIDLTEYERLLRQEKKLGNDLMSSILNIRRGPEYRFSQCLQELRADGDLNKFLLSIVSDAGEMYRDELNRCFKDLKNYKELVEGIDIYDREIQNIIESFTGNIRKGTEILRVWEQGLYNMGLARIY